MTLFIFAICRVSYFALCHDDGIGMSRHDAVTSFSMIALCVSSEFNRQFSLSIKMSWKVRQALVCNALFHLSPDDRHYVMENYDFLKAKCQSKDFPQRPAILRQLLQILSVEMLLRIESYIKDTDFQNRKTSAQTQNIEIGNNTSAQNIFCRFTSLLEQTPV